MSDTVELHRAANEGRVEPATAPGATGGGAELTADLAEVLLFFAADCGGEGARADPSGVRLGDTDDLLDVTWTDTSTCAGCTGQGV